MTAGSGSGSNSNSQQMSMSEGSTSHYGGMTASTSNTTLSNGFVESRDNDPASVLAIDPTFGPDLSAIYNGMSTTGIASAVFQLKINRRR